jgi:hypothetical protein
MTTVINEFPVGEVAVSGQDLTVSQLLNDTRFINARVQEVASQFYLAPLLLPNAGTTNNGVIVYEEWSPDQVQLDRRPEDLSADSEVPLAGITVGDLKSVIATEQGIGYAVTRQEERHNRRYLIDRRERAMAYTLALDANRRAISVIKQALADGNRTFPAPDWSAVNPDGANPTPRKQWPHHTIAQVRAIAQKGRIPFVFDTLLVDPLEAVNLETLYEGQAAQRIGVSIVVDNTGDVEQGKPILTASGGLGGTVVDDPVETETIPEPRRRRKVVQATGSLAYFVDNKYGALQLVGTADEELGI